MSGIRAALLKGRSSGDPAGGAVEEVALDLKRSIARIHTAQREAACSSGISPARVTGSRLVTAARKRASVLSPSFVEVSLLVLIPVLVAVLSPGRTPLITPRRMEGGRP